MKKVVVLVVMLFTAVIFSCGNASVKNVSRTNDDETVVDDSDSGKDTADQDEDVPVCGDGKIEGDEVCEPGDVIDCVVIDPVLFEGGKARCLNDCSGWDTITCDKVPMECGNDIVEGTEVCDSNSIDCTILDPVKYESGIAHCNSTCDGWDTDFCYEFEDSECGNGIVEGNEVCDGNIIDCVEINSSLYEGGKAKCLSDCSGWDTATCDEKEVPVCTDKCSPEGSRRCHLNNVEECVTGTDGCLDWDIHTYCNAYTCETSGGTSECVPNCTNQCTLNHKTCENNNVMKCVNGSSGCTVWELEENCLATLIYPFCGLDGATSAKCYADPQVVQEYTANDSPTFNTSQGAAFRGNVFEVTKNAVVTGFKIHLQQPSGASGINVPIMVYESDTPGGTYTRIHRSDHTVGANGYYGPTDLSINFNAGKYYVVGFYHPFGTGYYYTLGSTSPIEYSLIFGKSIGNMNKGMSSEPDTPYNFGDPYIATYRMWIESYLH